MKEGQTQEPVNPTPVKELETLELLELVCQLHSRSLSYPSQEMHHAYVEARMEMESRLTPPPAPPIKTEGEDEKNIAVVNALAAKIHDRMLWPAGGLDKYNAAIREVTIRAIIKGFEAGYAAKTKNTPNE